MGKRLVLFWYCVLLGSLAGYANQPAAPGNPAQAGGLSLEQVRRLVRENHPALQALPLEEQAAAGRVRQAAARPNPSLTLEAENVGGQGEYRRFARAEYTAQIAQPLELGGKRAQRRRVALSEQSLTAYAAEAQRLDVEQETLRRFVAVLQAQEQCALSEDFLGLARSFHQAVAARVRAGKVSPTEETKAEIMLAQQQLAAEEARQELIQTRRQLAALWGAATPDFDRVLGTLPPPQPLAPLPNWLARLPRNPDLARWKAEIEQRRAVAVLAAAERMPDLTLGGGVRHFSESEDQALVFSAALPLPLFDRQQGRREETRAALAKAVLQQRAAELQAAEHLAETHQSLQTLAGRLAALHNQVLPKMQAVYEAATRGYQLGKFTYWEVLDAQRTCYEARRDYLKSLAAYRQGLSALERLTGAARTDL